MPIYTDAMGMQSGSDDAEYSANLESKTDKPADTEDDKYKRQAAQKVEQLGENNVLNGYRSVTYNFTLAGLNKNYLKDPTKYREGELDLVILKSGGKGTSGMKLSSSMSVSALDRGSNGRGTAEFSARDPRRLDLTDEQKATPPKNFGQEFIDNYNSDSPGRFDMFLENVEIESVMSFSPETNTSLPTKIKFDVIEPYSINGFIEALQVAAIGAGYPSYLQASFLLKVEFWGYPDDQSVEVSAPVLIPKSERYYPIGFVAVEVDITERGTRYKCSAVPHNERAFGNPNTVKKPIKMEGDNVGAILTNFMDNLNKQVAKSDKEGKEVPENNNHDTYSIKFPSWSETDGWVDSPSNKIAESKLAEIFKDNALYGMVDPSTVEKPNAYKADGSKQPSPESQAKEPEKVKYTPGKTVIQFAEGMNVNDAITAVIRDSMYIRDMLKDVKKNIDQYGMLEYFLIKIEMTNLDVIDTVSKKPFQNFCYVVTPYKIHYTRVPTYGSDQIEEEKLKKLSLREYNFIYTGKNVDVLDFKLKFDYLFFEAISPSNSNKDVPAVKTGAGATNGVEVKTKGTDVKTQELNQVPLAPVKTVDIPVQPQGGSGSQQKDDPYSVMARNMHNAVVNSKASMVQGDLTILGDPFFLVTGGVGNYNPKPTTGRGKLENGEAAHTYSELLITVNFRNPIDIQNFEQGGQMYFNPDRVPFSGIYRVLTAKHSFKDGKFQQKLEILRMPGQILDQPVKPSKPEDRTTSAPATDDQALPEVSPDAAPSQRLEYDSAVELLDRGLPSPGLPGELSNFTSADGGLGGTDFALLNQTSGFSPDMLSAGSSIIGQSLPTDISSNIRLNAAGLASVNQSSLSQAALISAASNVATNNVSIDQVKNQISGAIASSSLAYASNKPNIGSGIGEGASVKLSPASFFPSSLTMNDIRSGQSIDSTKLPLNSLSNLTTLNPRAMPSVQGMGGDVSNFIGGIGNKITALSGTPADPMAIAAKVGIDASKISGLSPNLQSKVLDQISSLADSTPANVNLSQAVNSGLSLNQLSAKKIPNIPATSPYATVFPTSGQSIPSIPSSGNIVDTNVTADKFNSVRTQLAGLTGNSPIPDRNAASSVISKYGSNSAGLSPLDRLLNKLS